jgi:uncharacterized protein DUF2637
MSTTNDFRTAAGLRRWPVAVEDLAAADAGAELRGAGLYQGTDPDGHRHLSNVRKIAGRRRAARGARAPRPGWRLIVTAALLLVLVGAGLFYVSYSGQYKFLFAARGDQHPSAVLSVAFDACMIIFALLALGLSMARKSSRVERALIIGCSSGSAAMCYAAADDASPRSVIAFTAAPILLAAVADRVIAVVRRHVLGEDEGSAWSMLGHALVKLASLSVLVLLYLLRFVLAPRETSTGLRRVVLNAAPLPATSERPAIGPPDAEPPELAGASKKARLAWWYERDADYGNRSAVAAAAKRLAPRVDLAEGTARTYLGQICADLEKAGETS